MDLVQLYYGGLEKVANIFGVQRVAGRSHDDSLLALQTFRKFLDVYFKENSDSRLRHNGDLMKRLSFVLHGLELIEFDHSNRGLKLNPFSE